MIWLQFSLRLQFSLLADLSLSVENVIRIYGIRWDIEVFFKCTESLLRLQKEFHGRSYDLLINHCFAQLHQGLFAEQQNTDYNALAK